MDWSHLIEGGLALYGAYSTWRAQKHKRDAIKAKEEARRTGEELRRVSVLANQMRAAEDLAEQARNARDRARR